ncbi:MAG: RluA family pseudouridine synthase [Candidatus Komeilibacteria bacterium]|nr:RluA family pseudouridine synthase [Candidatus Komeilibacteria bacterium]
MSKLVYNQEAKERLDKFLTAQLPELSRAKIQKLIKIGEIEVNGKKAIPHQPLKTGDVIALKIIKAKAVKAVKISKELEPKIIAEEKDYLIINKPSGLIVHHADNDKNNFALSDWLVKKYPSLKKVGEDPIRPGIVHRLDKEASGLMVIPKNQKMFQHLKSQFQNHLVKKEYLALAYGKIINDEGLIDFPLSRSKISGKMAAQPQGSAGRSAITNFVVLKRFSRYTYLKVIIKTGRSHQIRAHLKAYGYPLVGDKLYENKKIKPAELKRLFLHAATLGFNDLQNKWREFNINLPKELKNFLNILK